MDEATYKSERAILVDEEKCYYNKLRNQRDLAIEKCKNELDVFEKLYTMKKEEHDVKIRNLRDEYYKQKGDAKKKFDERFQMLKEKQAVVTVYEDKTPFTWEQSLDLLLNDVATKYNVVPQENVPTPTQQTQVQVYNQEVVHISINHMFQPPTRFPDNTATYYGKECAHSSKIVTDMTPAKKRMLYTMIEHVVDCIRVHEREIQHHLSYKRKVAVSFEQARQYCSTRKMVYVDAQRRFIILYFDYIFRNHLSRRIMSEMIKKKLNMKATVHDDSCVLHP